MSEYGEELKTKNEIETKMFEMEKSYISKEELLNFLNNLDFKAVKDADFELITGFIADFSTGEVKSLSKHIELR